MMFTDPALLHRFLEHITDSLITYASYQIDSGAQVREGHDTGKVAQAGEGHVTSRVAEYRVVAEAVGGVRWAQQGKGRPGW